TKRSSNPPSLGCRRSCTVRLRRLPIYLRRPLTRIRAYYSGFEVVRVVREDFGAALGYEDDVLEPHAAVSGAVQPGLDGDDVADHELLVGRDAEAGRLVDLEADTVAEPVEKPVGERLARRLRPRSRLACRLEDLAASVEDRARVGARRCLRDGPVERLLDEAVPLAHVGRNVADDEGPR